MACGVAEQTSRVSFVDIRIRWISQTTQKCTVRSIKTTEPAKINYQTTQSVYFPRLPENNRKPPGSPCHQTSRSPHFLQETPTKSASRQPSRRDTQNPPCGSSNRQRSAKIQQPRCYRFKHVELLRNRVEVAHTFHYESATGRKKFHQVFGFFRFSGHHPPT